MNVVELFSDPNFTTGLFIGGAFILLYQVLISFTNSVVNFFECKFYDSTIKKLQIKNLDLQNKLLALESEKVCDEN